ncbi:MAG: NlpC/P60 family protein [Candidatus Omnitrophica bacterium]|nr:NlpC/P60 family protein [Candidatus Omnitrophota bacterium]
MNPEVIIREAQSWLATPFRAHAKVKGDGVDCVNLALAIYQKAGILPADIVFPPYHIGSGAHLDLSAVAQFVIATRLFRLATAPFKTGDLLGFNLGKVIHHVGIYIERDNFVHCCQKAGVIFSRLDDPTWGKRLQAVWRPITKAS